jgi:hypothetical protein
MLHTIGFAIWSTTSNNDLRANCEDRGINFDLLTSEQVTEDALQIERNVLKWLRSRIISASDHGHCDEELIGNAVFDSDNRDQLEFIHSHIPAYTDPIETFCDSWFDGVSEDGKEIFDVKVAFFDYESDSNLVERLNNI